MAANNATATSLTTIIWNCNGILQRQHEFEIFLNDNRIDLALLSETHLTPGNYFNVIGYKVYRADHPDGTAHAGAAILIKSSITHHAFPLDPASESLQASAVSITVDGSLLNIAAIYCPPRFRDTTLGLQNLFLQLGPRFICGGDLNAKHPRWGSRLSNPRGRQLLSVLLDNNYSIYSQGYPTYWPTSQRCLPDVLDFYVAKGIDNLNPNVSVLSDLSSDHEPVSLELDKSPTLMQPPPTLVSRSMDWNRFKENVCLNLNPNLPLKTALDIEHAVEHFNGTIQNAAWDSNLHRREVSVSNSLPHYPQAIRSLIQMKRRARHRWQRSRSPIDKMEFNRLTNRLKSEIAKIKNERFAQHLSQLAGTDGSLWTATKRLMKYVPSSSPLRLADGTWAKTDSEKANHFSEHLCATFQPHFDVIDNEFHEHVDNTLQEPLQLSLPPPPFRLDDVITAIHKLPLRKSPGYDLISSEVLRQLPVVGARFLLFLFNAILRTSYFPIQWKFSTVIMVPKPNKPSHLSSSYRPISLLPVVSKLFERLLLPRITSYFEISSTIPKHQFGFRSEHSTIHQLQRVVDYIANGFERKLNTVGVFLDVSAAFDRVWHAGLLYKLKKVLSDSYFRLLSSFLHGRYFKVRQGQSYSVLSNIQAGVPQGAILSPTLYNVFTSDIPTTVDTLIATYADDSVLLGQDDSVHQAGDSVQQHLNQLQIWLRKWRIKVNAEKSVHVTFTLRRRTCQPLFLNNIRIPSQDKVKYLGLILDKRLTWAQHIKEKRLVLNNRTRVLYRLVCSHSALPLRQKRQIYITLLRPMWLYGSELYGTAKKSNLRKIQAFQSKFLRLITGAPFYVNSHILHSDLHLPTASEVIRWNYRRFHGKLEGHNNSLIQDLSANHYPALRRLRRSWSRDLLR